MTLTQLNSTSDVYPHTAVIRMAVASKSFGFGGEDFVTRVGARAVRGVGQSVVRVNIDNKTISNFLVLKNHAS